MTTENQESTTNDQQQTTPPSGDADAKSSERTVPVSALQKQAAEKDAERDAWRIKYEEIFSQMKQREEEAERKRLEDEGKFKEIAETEKRKREEAEASYKAKERRLTLEAKLAGITNNYTRKGVIEDCPADADIEEYVAQIRKDHPDLWKAPGVSASAEPAQGEQSKGGPGEDLESRLRYDDPKDPVGSAVIRAAARGEKAKAGGYG